MALAAHLAVSRHHQEIAITWMIDASNRRLASALDEAGVAYISLNLKPTSRLIRDPLAVLRKIIRCSRLLRKLKPCLVVLLQGWIMDGFDGAIASRLAGVPFCSYIPLAHNPVELGIYKRPKLRAALLSVFFNLIHCYITIDEQQAMRLRMWRRDARVVVVENFVPSPAATVRNSVWAREHLGIPADSMVLGVVGRVSFWQKSQDWLIGALKDSLLLEDKVVVFVGDGPDSSKLAELIDSSPWSTRLYQLGWRKYPDEIYQALDLLLIPSRAEGVPLVMIEALARHIPVVGADRDGMKSWLPPSWRFPFGDAAAMELAVQNALSDDASGHWALIDQRLALATDEVRFGREFGNALIEHSNFSLQ